MQIFIDANIFLDFYRLGKDDIVELDKLRAAAAAGDLILLVNDQLKNEVERNREKVIAEHMKNFKEARPKLAAPIFCRSHAGFSGVDKAFKEAAKEHEAFIKRLEDDVRKRNLVADSLISSIFDAAEKILIDDALVQQAELRVARGMPPGKNGSIGDAIHWLSLLAGHKEKDLYLISRDGDFVSDLGLQFREILLDEWKDKVKG